MPKIILLPGMDGTGTLLEPFAEAMGTTFEIEILRYPRNQPLSYSELEPLVQAAIPTSDSFILVAESFSTPLAIQIAARRPTNLKTLVISAGFVTSPVPRWKRPLYSLLLPIAFRQPPDVAIKSYLASPTTRAASLAAIRSAIASVTPNVLIRRIRIILACDARAGLAEVSVPILYLQPTHDRILGHRSLAEIQRIRPQTKVEEIPGPHLLLYCEPERSAAAIQAWLRTITQCTICKRTLDVNSDPLSSDCGGDCWGCISQVEAEMLGVSVNKYRADPGSFLPRI